MDANELLQKIYEKMFEIDKRLERVENQVVANSEDLATVKDDLKAVRDRLPVIERDVDFVLEKSNKNERDIAQLKRM